MIDASAVFDFVVNELITGIGCEIMCLAFVARKCRIAVAM